MDARFKKGQAVIYVKGNKVELGIIKQVVEVEERSFLKQDGLHGSPSGEFTKVIKYFVNYHSGNTAALTNECDLHPIENEAYFKIRRIKVKEN